MNKFCVDLVLFDEPCVVDLDRLEVVPGHAIFGSPSMCLLSVSVVQILDTPFRNSFIQSFPRNFEQHLWPSNDDPLVHGVLLVSLV